MGALPLTTTRRPNRSHQKCQALATVFVAVAPDGKGKLENKLVKAVADAGDGSSGIYEDRRTRRGRCLNYEILSNFFCSAPRSISQGTSRCDPLHRGGAAAKVAGPPSICSVPRDAGSSEPSRIIPRRDAGG